MSKNNENFKVKCYFNTILKLRSIEKLRRLVKVIFKNRCKGIHGTVLIIGIMDLKLYWLLLFLRFFKLL
jgi:hypothetical protein